jgi:hypothetical protein
VPAETNGFNACIYGNYGAEDRTVLTNNNVLGCDILAFSGTATISGTTNVDNGVPAIPEGGAGP